MGKNSETPKIFLFFRSVSVPAPHRCPAATRTTMSTHVYRPKSVACPVPMLVAAEGRITVSTSVATVQLHELSSAVTVLQEEAIGNSVNTRLRLQEALRDGRWGTRQPSFNILGCGNLEPPYVLFKGLACNLQYEEGEGVFVFQTPFW